MEFISANTTFLEYKHEVKYYICSSKSVRHKTHKEMENGARHQWLMLVILATQEAEIRRIDV
jgi:hypothetical protein